MGSGARQLPLLGNPQRIGTTRCLPNSLSKTMTGNMLITLKVTGSSLLPEPSVDDRASEKSTTSDHDAIAVNFPHMRGG
jgi:hypothetical protein